MALPKFTPSGLKVVALISGGKDSLFSILHCRQHGHEVVALANLYPAGAHEHTGHVRPVDDIDSYMYQTIGHTVIPLYAEALGLPLYREPIHGTNADTNKVYAQDDGDETESLIPLLQTVMRAHPDVNAVCTGAILSDYQRTRIESVALRLGLVPLAYLWQLPLLPPHTQTSLLEDMQAAGQDSRIIKVASGGLGEEHLWLGLGEKTTVQRLVRDFGRFGTGGLETGAVLGEGGEFETLAINGPSSLWKKRIVVENDQRTSLKGEGGTWMLRIGKASTVENVLGDVQAEGTIREPDLLDHKFQAIKHQFETDCNFDGQIYAKSKPWDVMTKAPSPLAIRQTEEVIAREAQGMSWQIKDTGDQLLINNMISESPEEDTGRQTKEIMDRLLNMLHEQDLSTAHISLSIILLRSMSDFALINKVYGSYFTRPSPPARVTIACGESMPTGQRLMMTVRLSRAPWNERIGLHVQSRSYWAPANIGPYSQAISVPVAGAATCRSVFVAGQIPLRPATMEIVPGDFVTQALVALQHLWRVGQTMRVQWWVAGAIAFVASATSEDFQKQAMIVDMCWTLAHARPEGHDYENEDEEEDIAEASLHRGWGGSRGTVSLNTPLWPLPDWTHVHKEQSQTDIPECFTVLVDRLPRDAQVEWWSQGGVTDSAGAALPRTYFLPLAKDSDLRQHDMEKLRQAKGVVEIFTAENLALDKLALAQELKAMVIPCRGIYSKGHGKVEILFRYS